MVVLRTGRRHAGRLSEDGGKLGEDGLHEVVGATQPCRGPRTSRYPVPEHHVVVVPERHGEGAQIPKDLSSWCQPLSTEDNIVAGQRQGEQIDGENVLCHSEHSVTVHAWARHLLAVGHCHLQLITGTELEVSAFGRFHRYEVVRGPRVNEGEEGDAPMAILICMVSLVRTPEIARSEMRGDSSGVVA